MKKFTVLSLLVLLFSASNVIAAHNTYNSFVITQTDPYSMTGNSTVVNLLKTPQSGYSEIAFFESADDLSMISFQGQTPFDIQTSLISNPIIGGAADLLGITSTQALSYIGNGPATMFLDAYNGSRNIFDPIFSNYSALVFDVKNMGSAAVDVYFRLGPGDMYSPYAIYSSTDEFYNLVPANIITIAAGDTATFKFDLGQSVSDPNVIWDFANNPSSQFYVRFAPNSATSFNVAVDNIGLLSAASNPLPEPSAMILFGLGVMVKLVYRKKN
ncbi:MAG: PEP-CTERM sorting domain-containing protein [Candidatus Auribacterota bacterium]|jgi:hypothetical protein|uniref:PEP-CTERM sorting domain-containing protein n=1 Tax=Candidatus Auribacter fodinae TaxID=2093366 RepID=A0A3A4R5W3_9BACT|nr:MAG: PEP-CTERM sorting domain-containing protein [Candidatus Auribacter fodinae]